MRIFNRYIAKEIITAFILGLSIFTFILLMDKILKLTELVVGKGVGFTEVIGLIIYILPSFFVVTIPMAFLLAVLLAFGRLSTDEELTAAKSSGISLLQMLPPVFSVSFIIFLVTLFLMIFALPWGNHSFKVKIYDIVKKKADTSIIPGRVVDTFDGMILYIKEKDAATGRFRGVLISEEGNGNSSGTVVAKEGEVLATPDALSVTLRLYDGAIHREGTKDKLQYKVVNFEEYDITLSMNFDRDKKRAVPKGDRELSIGEILEKTKDLKEKGLSYDYLLVELHKKFSIPFACIVFALIGVPLGIQGKRSGKSHGFIISLLLITLYWIFLLGGEALGDKGTVPPYLAMWAPNIFFLVLGTHLLMKANRESEIKLLSLFELIYGSIADVMKGRFRKKR